MKRYLWTTVALCALLAAFGCSPPESAPAEEVTPTGPPAPVVVADNLNGPIAVLVEDDGSMYVSESGSGGDSTFDVPMPDGSAMSLSWGDSARLIHVDASGTQTVVAMLPSFVVPEGAIGTGRFAVKDGVTYVTSGAWGALPVERPANMAWVLRLADGAVTEYVDAWAVEDRDDPDPANKESNPFDLTVGPDDALWMTDAAANALYRINPETNALERKAVFAMMPSPIPNPARGNAMEMEPVPTAVAFDPDGNVYVSLLTGIPHVPGASKVVRVAPDGTVTDYATGFSMLTDLVAGPDGQLYAVSLGEFTGSGPTPSSGALFHVEPGTASVPLLTGLSSPASVAFTAAGDAFLTVNAIGAPGTGQVVKYAHLLAMR